MKRQDAHGLLIPHRYKHRLNVNITISIMHSSKSVTNSHSLLVRRPGALHRAGGRSRDARVSGEAGPGVRRQNALSLP